MTGFSPQRRLGRDLHTHLRAGRAYSYEWVESRIPPTRGREFTRGLGTPSLRYVF